MEQAKEIATVVNPQLWADQGGILGLIVLALIVALFAFMYVQIYIFKALINGHSQERSKLADSFSKIIDNRMQENNLVISGLTEAVEHLARRKRFSDD